MAANGISTLATKEARQKAKLELAANNRSATGRRASYDITQLPTQYDDNGLIDNSNAGGLILGRPWITTTYAAGAYRTQYGPTPTAWTTNDANPTWAGWSGASTATSVATNFDLTLTALETQRAFQWIGYFLPSYTGVHTFSTGGANVDDCVTLWIGATARSGYTTANAVMNASLTAGSGTISLTAGTYYPLRVQFGNNSGPGSVTIVYSHTGQTATNVYTGKLFYNSTSNTGTNT